MEKNAMNVVGLIGYPVHHSFSPAMQNCGFHHAGLNYTYVTFEVKPQNLKSAIEGAESLDIKGLNVTIPHKINVIKYLDELDEIANLIGAVNTIDFKDMKGYNTDGIGAIKAIEEKTSVKNKKIVIAGAGGASRAISFYMAKYGAESLTILNRDVKKADKLSDDISNSNLINAVNSDALSNITSHVEDADILINTTPIGMHPNDEDTPILTSTDIHENLFVFDAVYNPNLTRLLKETVKANATPIYGKKMLLYQGAESFEIWTGKKAPIPQMEKALNNQLSG